MQMHMHVVGEMSLAQGCWLLGVRSDYYHLQMKESI